MKTAYAFNPTTLIFTGAVPVSLISGYPDYIKPKFALWEPAPEHNPENQQCRADLENQTWTVEAKPQKIAAYHKETQAEKVFSDVSEVTDDYTVDKPTSPFDEWTPQGWKTNEQIRFEHRYEETVDARRSEYTRLSDPLYMEAYRLKRKGLDDEAEAIEKQADGFVEKIKAAHPWPTPPGWT
ncbi:hypothetical protein [Enterovibrio nigricans]|uniref:Uncharacterized protein n=1 Tax=Enterovibrio nigricans DSM 22720 TaxID=1121868 RepID=A0A1T4UEN8_9GAMM|nr:hypothetical protein [Enterovibrio nigricans]PKF51103.1 hypothetical protein AT251_06290 [Enterovibrio nigricans]SKA51157.1 hypothetical protein SAMN02745132_01559 [Enterovibrio nigricans DSM 22720]